MLTTGFDATGSGKSAYVHGPSSNGAFVWRLDSSVLGPPVTDPSPFHEPAVAVADADDTSYVPIVSGVVAVTFNGSVLWKLACPAGLYAVTSPALVPLAAGTGLYVVCSSATSSWGALGTNCRVCRCPPLFSQLCAV